MKRKLASPPSYPRVGDAHLWGDEASLVSLWTGLAFIPQATSALALFPSLTGGLEVPGAALAFLGTHLHLSPFLPPRPTPSCLLQLTHALKDAKRNQRFHGYNIVNVSRDMVWIKLIESFDSGETLIKLCSLAMLWLVQ